MRIKLLFVTLLVSGFCWGQMIIFSESIGTVTGTTTIDAHETANGFDNDAYTMTGGGAANPGDIRDTTPSTGYSGASGGDNIWFTTTNAQYGFAIEGIDASVYTSLTLNYGYYKFDGAAHATFAVEYWNGAAWVSIANTATTLFNEAASATTSWYSAKQLSLPAAAQISGLKIRFLKSGTKGIRIDDIVLRGTSMAPTVAWDSTATSICYNGVAQTTTLGYSASSNSPVKYSIAWNSTPVNSFVAINDAPFAFGSSGTITINVPTGTAVGTYTGTITAKNAGGYTSIAKAFTVTVSGFPIAAASNSGPYCAGSTIQLTGGNTGYTNYVWTGPNGYSGIGDVTSLTVTQDFNSLTTLTSGVTWVDNVTIPNWYSQRTGSDPNPTIKADTGVANAGGLYSYGTSASDRALGSLGSGNTATGSFAHGLLIQNTAGVTIDKLDLTYALEQWRDGGANNAQSVIVSYKISPSPITSLGAITTDPPTVQSGWTPITAATLTSPIASLTAKALDGDASANRATASNVILTGLSIPPNNYIMIKWEDPDHALADDGLAIDDVSVTLSGRSPNVSIANATPAMSGDYTIKVTNSSGCSATATTNVVVDTAGTVSSDQTICSGSIPTPLTLSGNTGSVIKWQSATNAAFTTGVTDIVNTTTTLTLGALTSTTYYRAVVQSSSCPEVNSNVVTITKNNVTSIWSGSSWDVTPTGETSLIFDEDYSSVGDLSGCRCIVKSGKTVSFNSGHSLTLVNELTVEDGASVIFNDTSSLIQVANTNTNSGNITYKRKLSGTLRTTDYTYWSTPVANQTLSNISPSSSPSKFYTFNSDLPPDGDWVQESTLNVMTAGKGYIIAGSPASWEASFIGTPNNGHYAVTGILKGKLYLIGNPYPSALDADTFILNNKDVIDGTLYFWTHNTDIKLAAQITNGSAGSGVYAYTSDDYASYNLTGGVGTGAGDLAKTGGSLPSGKIGAAQGFFTTGNDLITVPKEIVFDNYMRVGVGGITGSNSQFFKQANNKSNSIEKNRIWLDLYNKQGAFKQTLVGYVTGATNEYNAMFDGETFDGNTYVDFYSINQDKNLTIQGRALPFDESDTVSLGYRSTIEGDFTIAINQTDGFFTRQNIYLEDKQLNIIHDLRKAPYEFTTEAGTFDDRFVLRYTSDALSSTAFESSTNNLIVVTDDKQLSITSSIENISEVTVYDVLGRKLSDVNTIDAKQYTSKSNFSGQQNLIVKIKLENGTVATRKVIIF